MSRLGGEHELVGEANGLLCKPEDAESLAGALHKLP